MRRSDIIFAIALHGVFIGGLFISPHIAFLFAVAGIAGMFLAYLFQS